MRFLAILLALLTPLSASAWETPARGTETRAGLMDAIRPHAEWVLGAPVVFQVETLRVSGDVAFANLYAVRPNGTEITRAQVPDRPGWDNPFDWDGPTIQVFYKRSGRTWVAVHHAVGATDVWWAAPEFCGEWRSVSPEFC